MRPIANSHRAKIERDGKNAHFPYVLAQRERKTKSLASIQTTCFRGRSISPRGSSSSAEPWGMELEFAEETPDPVEKGGRSVLDTLSMGTMSFRVCLVFGREKCFGGYRIGRTED